MDWDRLRIFNIVATANSFTQAEELLGIGQSSISRHISALEKDLQAKLFRRHARGLTLTEQGQLLFHTTQALTQQLEATRQQLENVRDQLEGELRVTTTIGIGTEWLTPRIGAFLERYPKMRVKMLLSDDDLDLSMREADVAIRLREPAQSVLIQRHLFKMHFHAYASHAYLKRYGQPQTLEDLDHHRILAYGNTTSHFLDHVNSLLTVGRDMKNPRRPVLMVNNIPALKKAIQSGIGIAVLPDYMAYTQPDLIQILPQVDTAPFSCYLVFPEEMKNMARLRAFRDFLTSSAQRWNF